MTDQIQPMEAYEKFVQSLIDRGLTENVEDIDYDAEKGALVAFLDTGEIVVWPIE